MPFENSPFVGEWTVPSWFAGMGQKAAVGSWESHGGSGSRPPVQSSSGGTDSYYDDNDRYGTSEQVMDEPAPSGRVMDDPKDVKAEKAKNGNGNGNGKKKEIPWMVLGAAAVGALILSR